MLSESSETNKNDTSNETEGSVPITTKSRTLPEYSCKYAYIKHKRSLSESKTMDGIMLPATTNNVSRTRFNSGTDSNTSGVSSYESVFGMVATDLCKTLSPIPSSSNLVEMKRVPSERFRRTSLTGSRYRDTLTSPQDAQGYEKLRSIRGHRRPQLSESAVDETLELLNSTSLLSNRLSVEQNSRRLKVRSLDRRSNYDMILTHETPDISRISDNSVYYTPNINIGSGQCYSGICLPKNILDLFPSSKSNGATYVTRCTKDPDSVDMVLKHGAVADFVSECDEYSVSSLSDISSTTSKRSRVIGSRHNRNTCLLCCRSLQSTIQEDTSTLIPSDLGSNDLPNTADNANDKPAETVNTEPPSSPSEYNLPDDNSCEKIQETILKHVQRMANPVWSKQSKLALAKIKQKHPHFFRSACLYSDICTSLSQNTYRFSARRFLQEIFGDVDYSAFITEAECIVNRKKELRQPDTDVVNNKNSKESDSVDVNVVVADTCVATATNSDTFSNQSTTLSSLPYSIRPHLAKSPLASVHETSKENLFDTLNKQLTTTTTTTVDTAPPSNEQSVDINESPQHTSSTSDMQDNSIAESHNAQNDNRSYTYSRPRFNTFTSGYSFTINKFPIGNRCASSTSNDEGKHISFFDYTRPITKSISGSIATGSNREKRLDISQSEALLMKDSELRRNSLNMSYKIGATHCKNKAYSE